MSFGKGAFFLGAYTAFFLCREASSQICSEDFLYCFNDKTQSIEQTGSRSFIEGARTRRSRFAPEVGSLFTPSTVVADTPTTSSIDCKVLGKVEETAPALPSSPSMSMPVPFQYPYQSTYSSYPGYGYSYPPMYTYPTYMYSAPMYTPPPKRVSSLPRPRPRPVPVAIPVPVPSRPNYTVPQYTMEKCVSVSPQVNAYMGEEPPQVVNPMHIASLYKHIRERIASPKNPVTITPDSICIDRPKREYMQVQCCQNTVVPIKPVGENNPLGELLEECACLPGAKREGSLLPEDIDTRSKSLLEKRSSPRTSEETLASLSKIRSRL
ncbi:hypothetical protein NECID01_1732 [Nematocida sp. AWRm77]|nr:hypothetical protein NECID01_1732 [Nematocida sp. AWRm77]